MFAICEPKILNRQQQPLDFLQPRLGVLFCEAREFAAERDEIAVAREHQLVVLHFDGRHGFFAGENFQFGHEQQQFHRRRQRAETVAQFLLQIFQRGFFIRLRQFAVNFDAMLRFGDVVVRAE